ncbi:hypothetical protein ILUMI_17640 [Ignelater luminosus]|uniref:SOCS box domain-containing protein n=1 Tax=Ignelater luminosus TaxID=2038154 RepID=A0A8K0CQN5_IGNLU|nr:hypothetical protein ILUMI_17640 [Ignelater luminosus]
MAKISTAVIPAQLNMENTTKGLVLAEDILRPYPKGQARKDSNRGRPKGSCTTATDTPEKMLIEDFKEFSDCLQMSNVGVDGRNENGETPLLACLKRGRSHAFIKCLVLEGASITIPDEEDITPLGFIMANNCWDTLQLVLEHCKDTQFMYEPKLNYTLRGALKYGKCQFKILTVNSGLVSENVFACIATSDPSYSCNTAIKELHVFLNLLEADKHLNKSRFNCICTTLIKQSIVLNSATAFKAIWKKDQLHLKLASEQRKFLYKFIVDCNFTNAEFIECLRLILVSRHAIRFLRTPYNSSIYLELFWCFNARNIDKRDRALIISRIVKLAKVTIEEVIVANRLFGFNEEVVILLRYLNLKGPADSNYSRVLDFIMKLEANPKLWIENLNKLELVAAASYRKLLYGVPEDILANNEVIEMKKRVLNEVPTLSVLSAHAFQMCLKNYHSVKDVNEFNTIVGSLPLPRTIKDSLCHGPPIYYG